MYNDPQGSYPPPNPQQGGNGNANDATQNFYPPQPQNPASQWGGPNFQQGPYPSNQNFTPPSQWGNGAANFQQGPYPPNQNSAPGQPNFVYASPSRRNGLVTSRSVKKNNFSMIMIGGATALALIIGLALFVGLSNQGRSPSTPTVQADVATPTVTPDTTTPTPEATATPMPTPTLVSTPTPQTAAINTTTPTAYTPPPAAAQQPAPVPTPKPAIPTPKPVVPTPKPVATPTVDPESFNYDYDPTNGTLVTNPPADFCTTGHEGPNAGVTCVQPFFPGTGYVVTCADGKHVSHDGGNGACTKYRGEGKKWYKHPIKN